MAGINLKVQIEINGQFVQAGHITGSSFRDAAFSYDESYITSPAARAISLSLPLSKKDFDTDATKSFFDGLLPEGFTRQCVADSIHASSDDYISILRQLPFFSATEEFHSGPRLYFKIQAGTACRKWTNLAVCDGYMFRVF